MAETKPNADALVRAFVALRDEKAGINAAFKDALEGINEKLDMVTAALLDICNEQDVDSMRTASGTVSRRQDVRYWASDWAALHQFIKEEDAFHLLEKRINNRNMLDYLKEHPDKHPVGLNSDTRYVVNVRKPSNR